MFQEKFKYELNEQEQQELKDFAESLMLDLYKNECEYTDSIYNKIGLSADVKAYVRYNANKAMMNLGFDAYFDEEDTKFSAIVENGLDTKTKNADFFSQKQTSYTKATIVPLEAEDFVNILDLPHMQH